MPFSMDAQVRRLVDKAWAKYQSTPPDQRLRRLLPPPFSLSLASSDKTEPLTRLGRSHRHRRHPGLRCAAPPTPVVPPGVPLPPPSIPGELTGAHSTTPGKTTLARVVSRELNTRAAAAGGSPPPAPATSLPMDGFHLTRAALSAMADPARAHVLRGAAFTFDAPKFLRLVRALRAAAAVAPGAAPVLAPSFDHAIKDPRDDDLAVLPEHRVVLVEGNYLALDRDVWRDAAALLDELWFIRVDFDVARRRLRDRHLRAGIAADLDDADRRVRDNDLVNARDILARRLDVDEEVDSTEDAAWTHA